MADIVMAYSASHAPMMSADKSPRRPIRPSDSSVGWRRCAGRRPIPVRRRSCS